MASTALYPPLDSSMPQLVYTLASHTPPAATDETFTAVESHDCKEVIFTEHESKRCYVEIQYRQGRAELH